MKNKIPNLIKTRQIFLDSKEEILSLWINDKESHVKLINLPDENDSFIKDYAVGVFDYFMEVISSDVKLGKCPIMNNLLGYLKDRNIRVDELFEMCNFFRKVLIDFIYDKEIHSKELLHEIAYLFDENFKLILEFYTDTIHQKEQEVNRSAKLLSEYKNALDESALISKTDVDGYITYVNDKMIQLCGFSEEELIGSKHNIMKHQDMSNEYYKNLWEELKRNSIYKGIIKNTKKNGESFYIDVTIVKINDPYDDSNEYMSVAYDITTLVNARLEAIEASKAKEYFLSNMSHEIRTPLNAILGFVNLLIDEDISKKHRKYLDIIFNSGENLLSIINDILDFSKLRSGEFSIDPKVFSIHEEISHTLELFVAGANSKNITITSFIDPTIPSEIFSDPLRIQQIVSNFLSNSIKFTPYGGVISVEVTCDDNILKIRVKDNGIGIEKEDLKNIFTAFAQAQHSQKKKNDGTGLGLSICKQLAEHMNGTVTANSAVGKGSTFWLKVPVEIRSDHCKIFDEVEEFKGLKIVFYSTDESTFDKYEAFVKYTKTFGMNAEVVDNLDMEFDVAILIYEKMDDKLKSKIISSNKKYIVLMGKYYNDFEKYSNIVSICFPLYCSKIKSSFLELLNPDSYIPPVKKISNKYVGNILIAEDNEANQELIKILLSKFGLTYDLANNGLEALELYKSSNKYDLILMDEQMPIMDGNETVEAILKYEKENGLKHTPVSALTANVVGVKDRGLNKGYDSFLGKPIILKEIEKVFNLYLKPALQTVSEVIEVENESVKGKIEGVDANVLSKELMLSEDELVMLLEMFIKKMNKLLPELLSAIEMQDFKQIALISHSIKGSSGNFRIELLQKISSEMEKMAKDENMDYEYKKMYEVIKNRIGEIKIS